MSSHLVDTQTHLSCLKSPLRYHDEVKNDSKATREGIDAEFNE